MKQNYKWCIDRIIKKYEGGYSNHPNDPGGPTMFGITYIDLAEYLGVDKSKTYGMMQHMMLSTAEAIYAKKYATASRFDDLPSGVDMCILDYSINSGIGRSPRVLQAILGLPQSKYMNDATMFAAQKVDPLQLIDRICDERLHFMHGLRGWPTFGAGWGTRVADLRTTAKSLVKAPVSAEVEITPLALVDSSGMSRKATHIDPKPLGLVGKGMMGGVGGGAASHMASGDYLTTAVVIGGVLILGGIAYYEIARAQKVDQEKVILPLTGG